MENAPLVRRVKDLSFGAIEAKHEIIGASEVTRLQFEQSFVKPSSVDSDDFVNGSKFIVYGLKGTGKTALMHYTAIQAQRCGYSTKFLLFSRDVTEHDRQNLSRAAGFSITEDNSKGISQDFEAVWLWFFHRHIAEALADENAEASDGRSEYVKYIEQISGDSEDSWKTKFWRLLPRFRNGKIEVKGKLPVAEATIAGEFEKNSDVREIRITRAAERASELLQDIQRVDAKLLIFVDELELSLASTVDFVRDGRTISGLIRAASQLNEALRIKGFPIKIICAIRSEVLRSNYVSGDEINKIVFDFGVLLRWNNAFDDDRHPLIKIIENRIAASIGKEITPELKARIWASLFPDSIQGTNIKRWILDRTWYRPRDIVRMLTICRDFEPDSSEFTQNAFEQSARDYSDSCWVEIAEELRASYTAESVEAISKLFDTFPSKPQNLDGVKLLFKKKSESHADVKRFITGKNVEEMLENFFRVGIIGNEHRLPNGKTFHNWYCRKGDHIMLDKKITVHRGLRHAFRFL